MTGLAPTAGAGRRPRPRTPERDPQPPRETGRREPAGRGFRLDGVPAGGAAVATHLRGDHDGSRLMAGTLRRHGLPVPAGESGSDAEEFVRAAEFAPGTRPGRSTVLEHPGLSPARIRGAYADHAAPVAGRPGAGLTLLGPAP